MAFLHFLHRLQDHYLWLLGLLLMIEPVLDYNIERYKEWADQYVSRKVRTRTSISLSLVALFAACFLAFQDEYNETLKAQGVAATITGERDEARKQRDTNVSPVIDRISGDLIGARAELDRQKKLLSETQDENKTLRNELIKLQPKPPRHLTSADKENLAAAFASIKGEFPQLNISAPADGEAQGFARELKAEFDKLGISVPSIGFVYATNADAAPLQVVVKDLQKIPPKAQQFANAMVAARFVLVAGILETLGNDDFALIVGPR